MGRQCFNQLASVNWMEATTSFGSMLTPSYERNGSDPSLSVQQVEAVNNHSNAIPETSNGQRPESPSSSRYLAKYKHLSEYYDHTLHSNNRLRHRIYHVKKEINHLKQLKRMLCERLLFHNAKILDSNLEIPDNDSGASGIMDKVIGEVISNQAAHANPPKKRKTMDGGGKKKETKPKPASDSQAKRNIRAIIDSVITETHAASQGQRTNSTLENSFDCSESDQMSTDEMCGSGRLLRESSIDHLLPMNPDYESQQQDQSSCFKREQEEFLQSSVAETTAPQDSDKEEEMDTTSRFDQDSPENSPELQFGYHCRKVDMDASLVNRNESENRGKREGFAVDCAFEAVSANVEAPPFSVESEQ